MQEIPSDHSIRRNLRISEQVINFLEKLRMLHYELCSISQDINSIYSVPILFTTLYLFISIIFNIYFYFISETPAKLNYPTLYGMYYGYTCSIQVFALVTLVMVTSYTKNEARLTSEILHTIYERTEEMDDYITHFSLQLLQNNVEFTACHVFALDGTLLFSIVGAITTYLVIVIQFHSGLIHVGNSDKN